MNKIIKNIFAVIILFSLLKTGYSQDTTYVIKVDTIKTQKTKTITIIKVRTLPKFILHINGGYNSGAMELSSHNGGFSRDDYLLGKNFGSRHGYGVNLIGKLPLSKKGNLWLDFITGFDRFQSDLFAKNTEEGKAYYNSFNGGIGLEYNFTPTHKVKYFFGANPLLSVISGKAEITNPDNNRVEIITKSSVRIGYQAFLGFEYAFEKNFGVNMGIRFTHANLLLKNSITPIQDETLANPTSTIELNDDATPEPMEFAAWKQFAYFSINAGFSYFFGVKEVKYKLPEK